MSAEMHPQTPGREPTPVAALTAKFANMRVAEKHEVNNVMQQQASGPRSSGILALQTAEETSKRVWKQKKHPQLAVATMDMKVCRQRNHHYQWIYKEC